MQSNILVQLPANRESLNYCKPCAICEKLSGARGGQTEIGVRMVLEKRPCVGLVVRHEVDERPPFVQALEIAHGVLDGTGVGLNRRGAVGREDHVRQGAER